MVNILLVGCGKMGTALINGWAKQGRNTSDIIVIEPDNRAVDRLTSKGITCCLSFEDLPSDYNPDVVLFAVKPQILDKVVPIYSVFLENVVFISIAAGKTISYLERLLGNTAAIARVMPNTPAAIGRGASGAFANDNVTPTQRTICSDLIQAVGKLYWLEREDQIDVVTAISGSGPAYVFLLSECLTQAGKKFGLPEELAEQLAQATVSGSGELLDQSREPPAILRQSVTSPGGTTEAALDFLMRENRLNGLMEEAIKRAIKRSKELSN